MTIERKRKLSRKLVFGPVLFVLFGLVSLIVIEGISSFVLLALTKERPLAERSHTQFDELLGWANIPNLYLPNMYGEGIFFQSNGQGFRNGSDIPEKTPAGKIRLICSGDSFTLGYGVSNDHTWCHLLQQCNPSFEIVNMGQGGYGSDQSFLWYKRDGIKLEHHIHVFALNVVDIERMKSDIFLGYHKPLLKINNGKLVVSNTPLPKRAFFIPWLQDFSTSMEQLRSIQLGRKILRRAGVEVSNPEQSIKQKKKMSDRSGRENDTETFPFREITDLMFQELKKTTEAHHAQLVMLYLPFLEDFQGNGRTKKFRRLVQNAAAKAHIPLIDLMDDFSVLRNSERAQLFIPPGTLRFSYSGGHYNEKGNKFVATSFYDKLVKLTHIHALLSIDKENQ